jgi:hypothetical protein
LIDCRALPGDDCALAEDSARIIVADGEALPHSFLKSSDRPSCIRKKQTESSAFAMAECFNDMGTISVVIERKAIKRFNMVDDSVNAGCCTP